MLVVAHLCGDLSSLLSLFSLSPSQLSVLFECIHWWWCSARVRISRAYEPMSATEQHLRVPVSVYHAPFLPKYMATGCTIPSSKPLYMHWCSLVSWPKEAVLSLCMYVHVRIYVCTLCVHGIIHLQELCLFIYTLCAKTGGEFIISRLLQQVSQSWESIFTFHTAVQSTTHINKLLKPSKV